MPETSERTVVVVGSIWWRGRLLLGRKVKDDTHISEQWHIPGGKLNVREEILQGLCREIQEETSLVTSPEDWEYLAATTYTDKVYLWFRATLPWTDEPRLEPGSDLQELAWFMHPEESMGEGCRYPRVAVREA